jgi:hypothetical protein
MGGRDEIDIMAAHLLKVKHHVCQVFILNFLPSPFVSDRPVLTEDTSKIAVGEEDGARSIPAHQGHLFAKMGMITKNDWFDWSSTETLFSP